MELFLNPWYMVAGGAMVSSPVIIHFINRLRYRRIRWAAMEFLLKAQKKNRRRLLIEQLILLLLRCLLVLIAAFLVARFVSAAVLEEDKVASTHVLILDDTLSTRDKWTDQGEKKITLDQGKVQIAQMVEILGRQETPQYLEIYTLSNGKRVFPKDEDVKEGVVGELLTTSSEKKVTEALKTLEPSLIRKAPMDAFTLAEKRVGIARPLPQGKDGKFFIHFVSDFREHDWTQGEEAEELRKHVSALGTEDLKVSLVDCAHPFRTGDEQEVKAHENVAVIRFQPEAPVAPVGRPVKFTVEIANFGEEGPNDIFVEIYKDGEAKYDLEMSRPAPQVPSPGKSLLYQFEGIFKEPGYHFLRVRLPNLDTEFGLHYDNEAYAVIEVREKLDVLIIDGDEDQFKEGPSRDYVELEDLLFAAGQYNPVRKSVAALDTLKDEPGRYSAIYFLNVSKLSGITPIAKEIKPEDKPEDPKKKPGEDKKEDGKAPEEEKPEPKYEILNRDPRLDALKDYVRRGGNVAFFMGDKVDAKYYHDVLNDDRIGEGLFPIPLTQTNVNLTKEDIEKRRQQRLSGSQPQIVIHRPERSSDEPHPALLGLSQFKDFELAYIEMTGWSLTKAREDWNESYGIEELLSLPNPRNVGSYTKQAEKLRSDIDEAFAKFKKKPERLFPNVSEEQRQARIDKLEAQLEFRTTQFLTAYEQTDMTALGNSVLNMLNDRGDPDDREKSLQPFWTHSDVRELRARLRGFANDVKYGPPLMVERPFGKGHVLAYLSTLAPTWHNWQNSPPRGRFGFPIFMIDLAQYLTETGEVGEPHYFGDPITFRLDAKRFDDTARPYVLTDINAFLEPGRENQDPGENLFQPLKAVQGKPIKGDKEDKNKVTQYEIEFKDLEKPTVVYFEMDRLGSDQKEKRYYAVNLNANKESPLRRLDLEELVRPYSTGKKQESADKTRDKASKHLNAFYQKRDMSKTLDRTAEKKAFDESDWSRSPWLYLVIFLILIAEQAMAVHLSHHKGSTASVPEATLTGAGRTASAQTVATAS